MYDIVEPLPGIEPGTFSFVYTSSSFAYTRGLDCIFLHVADPCQSFGRVFFATVLALRGY